MKNNMEQVKSNIEETNSKMDNNMEQMKSNMEEMNINMNKIDDKMEQLVNKVEKRVDQVKEDIHESHLYAIADGLLERKVHANESIYTQGEFGDEFYIVKKGQFYVLANGTTIDTHEDSGYFGEMALLYNMQRRNTVKAATEGLLWYVKRSNFKQILAKSEFQNRKNYIDLLKKVNIFKNMTEHELEKTADAVKYVHFYDGEVIAKQGEKAESLMIVENGKARLTTITEAHPEGKEDFILAGAYFGELALLSEITRSSTVTAIGDVFVLVLDADTFARTVGNCHEIVARNPQPIYKEKSKRGRERAAKDY